MQADYFVELGVEDPVLDFPWSSDDPSLRYYDLKNSPELVRNVAEAREHPELGAFLTRMNAVAFPLQTAKCDAWFTTELAPEEEIFGVENKFGCYVDLLFVTEESQMQFERHELLVKRVCALLKQAPEIAGAAEFMIRRCYYQAGGFSKTPGNSGDATDDSAESRVAHEPTSGFYITAYMSGFGATRGEACQRWTIVLHLVQNALVQAGVQSAKDQHDATEHEGEPSGERG